MGVFPPPCARTILDQGGRINGMVDWRGSTLTNYYIHTEIYTLKSRRVNFSSQTDVNQSNVAYRFSHM